MKSLFVTVLNVILYCKCENSDLGYSLNVGHAIDIFANYGDLSQVTQVISAAYEEDQLDEPPELFKERNIRIFENATSTVRAGDLILELEIKLCESFDDLLTVYFQEFKIEGTSKPWKAFMGDWIPSEIMRTFGIIYDMRPDDCCYVLIKLRKSYKTVQLDDINNFILKNYLEDAIEDLDINDPEDIRRFMRSYGTHYIESYVTGNFIYQVFKYKRQYFNLLRSYVKALDAHKVRSDDLRFYFSSIFLHQVGDIRTASGNQTIEAWARRNLHDSQYLYSRPNILKPHYNPVLAFKLNKLLEPGALLGLNLKTLTSIFRDSPKGTKYSEIVQNDMQLWEVNA